MADVEAQARRIMEFLGVPWDARCLDFHDSGRAVQTPSRWQVRQPIYTRSVERWRHYAELLPELEPNLRAERGFTMIRQGWVLVHRWVGLTIAAFLFMSGLTGAVISWDQELDDVLNSHLTRVESRGELKAPLDLARRSRRAIRVCS